jgi:hypothetical protein
MTAIEYAVRPSVPTPPHGATIIASTPGATRERATLTWGAAGTLPFPQVSVQLACCKDDLKETSRNANTIPIFQNNDSSSENWVDVERPFEMSLDNQHSDGCNQDSGSQSAFAPIPFGQPGSFEPDPANTKTCKTTWKFNNGDNTA